MVKMQVIDANYKRVSMQPSDIFEHIPTLCRYALECERIVEVGVRGVVSTWAFLKGLAHNDSDTKQLICVDIEDVPTMDEVFTYAKEVGIDMRFICGNSATIDFRACSRPAAKALMPLQQNDEYDLLFIDSFHVCAHLERELAAHAGKIKKYIIMHDTESDGIHGESVRCGYNIPDQVKSYGYEESRIRQGLNLAVNEFLAKNPDWKVKERFTHNSGLLVLARI